MRRLVLLLSAFATLAVTVPAATASVYCVTTGDTWVLGRRVPTATQVCVPGP